MSNYTRPKERIELREVDESLVKDLSEKLKISEVLSRILVGRGLVDFEGSRGFFNPSLDDFHSPFLFSQMNTAIERILQAISSGETISIYGDYDVDGVTSTTFLVRVFRKLQIPVQYYLPDRLTEGYGLSNSGIDAIKEKGASLIISVDCGITAMDVVDYANSIGIDMIITDHHEAKETLPDAVAVINPKIPGETYPDKNLAGVGVALKLAQALCEKLNVSRDIWCDELDIVSLGTAADIVPFVGENRIIAKFGYEQMQNTQNKGLRQLMTLQKATDKIIYTTDVVFKLAPAINAAGRLGNPEKGLKLFLSEDEGECYALAKELIKVNNERRAYNEKVEREAKKWAEENVDFENEFCVIHGDSSWHAGVIGIAASKVVEEYCRPAFLFSIDEEGVAHGSGRSIEGCDLVKALNQCDDLLEKYGGHKMASGASLKADNLPEFRRRFNLAVKEQLEKAELVQTIYVDVEANLPNLTPKFFNTLKRMEPFGPKNMRPVLYSRNLKNKVTPRAVGKGGNHLKLTVFADGQVVDAIGFGFGDRVDVLKSANSFSLAYTLTENNYRGVNSLQMNIKGIEIEY